MSLGTVDIAGHMDQLLGLAGLQVGEQVHLPCPFDGFHVVKRHKKIQPPSHSRRLAAPCGVADYVKGAVLFSDMEKADWIAPIGFFCLYFLYVI